MRLAILIFVLLISPSIMAAKPVFENDYMREYVMQGNFADAREALELAITGKGLVINNISHIGNMLQRTGKDIGANKNVYQKAEAMEFCSANLSRKMMEADPRNIVFCPFIITVYTLAGEENTVHLAYRKPLIVGSKASRKSLKAVNKLIDDIVQATLEW